MKTCPCCGHQVFKEYGHFELCPICFWEDDDIQMADPWYQGGANSPCLYDAQKNYIKFGAMEEQFKADVRLPTELELKDPSWRLVNESDRKFVIAPKEIESRKQNNVSIPWEYWMRKA